jgi:WD40 repeat protein
LLIVNLQNPGRLGASPPLIRGHSGAILDADFYPFFDRWVLTASEDTSLKLWEIPEGGMTEDISEPKGVLNGHSKKVPLC